MLLHNNGENATDIVSCKLTVYLPVSSNRLFFVCLVWSLGFPTCKIMIPSVSEKGRIESTFC